MVEGTAHYERSFEMNPREAFRTFIRFQLMNAAKEGRIELSDYKIEKFAKGIEDDPVFYERLDEFLAEFIGDFGENYGLS